MPYQTQFDIIERRARLSSIEPPRDLILGKKKKKLLERGKSFFLSCLNYAMNYTYNVCQLMKDPVCHKTDQI